MLTKEEVNHLLRLDADGVARELSLCGYVLDPHLLAAIEDDRDLLVFIVASDAEGFPKYPVTADNLIFSPETLGAPQAWLEAGDLPHMRLLATVEDKEMLWAPAGFNLPGASETLCGWVVTPASLQGELEHQQSLWLAEARRAYYNLRVLMGVDTPFFSDVVEVAWVRPLTEEEAYGVHCGVN